MDPALVGPALSVVSGALMVLLGLALAWRSARRVSTVAFAVFLALWGSMIVLGNGARLTPDDGLARLLTLLFVAFFVVVYVPLLVFVDAFPSGRRLVSSWPRAALLLAPAALGALTLLARPDLLFAGFDGGGLSRAARWGPLFPLLDLLFFGSFILAVLRLHRLREQAAGSVEAKRLTLVLAALSLYVAYAGAQTVVQYVVRWPVGAPGLETLVFLGDSAAGLAALAWIALRLRGSGARGDRRLATWAIAVPALFGLASGVTRFAGVGVPIETLGLFRLASVVLLAYAILRFELFDIEVRAKRGAIAAALLLGTAVLAVLVEQALERVVGSTGVAITLTQIALVGGVAAVAMTSPRFARAWGERLLPGVHAPARLDARRLEVYEAALARAAAAGPIADDDAFLRDLRARLGVSEGEHQLLARLVQRAPRAAPVAFAPGARVAGRYRLERLLGEGASGAAWLAADQTLARHVVVKALHARAARSEEAGRAFLAEARTMASLDHPNVLRVFDFGEEGGAPFLVMELVEGGSLESRLARGPLRTDEARRVAQDVLRGLSHVHARGVLHGDVKPGNVLLAADGTAKIGDFGVAVAGNADETMTGLEPPRPRGTLATMSPEAVRGRPLTRASDVYSAGALLYRAATGGHYLDFDAMPREAALAAVVADPPRAPPPGADAALVAVAMRALEKDPGRRFASAEEMLAALERPTLVA